MGEVKETYFEKQITCPYCGYEFRDSWEYTEDCDDMECPECEKTFAMGVHLDISYCTKGLQEIDMDKHGCKDAKRKHPCLGKWKSTSNGADFDCGYSVPFSCDDCIINKKNGKRPWAKKYQEEIQ